MSDKFSGTKITKKFKFCEKEIDVAKLSVKQVLEIQSRAKDSKEGAEDNLEVLMLVVKSGAPDLKELTDEELQEFPMDELVKLSTEILKYSGLAQTPKS